MEPTDLPVLRVAGGRAAGRGLAVAGERATIGRGDEADLCIDDGKASKLHVAVVRVAGAWRIEDLGSRNGTALNGEKVVGPAALEPGDRVRVGATEVEFLLAPRDALRLRGEHGDEWPLVGTRIVVGRAGGGAAIALDDDKASREHAVLTHDDGGWTIADLASRNGTSVNGERLLGDRLVRLKPGDALRIGGTELSVVGGAEAPAPPVADEPPARASSSTRIVARPNPLRPAERPRTEVIDARAIAREIGLTGVVLKGVAVLVAVVLIVVYGVPALDRALNATPASDEGVARVAAPVAAPVRAPARTPPPVPARDDDAVPAPAAAPDEAAPSRAVAARDEHVAPLPEAAPPSSDARAPAFAPRLLAATYVGGPGDQRIERIEITAKGTIVARGSGLIALYESGCAAGAIAPSATPDPEPQGPFSLHHAGVAWRFADDGGQPAVTVGTRRWWDGARPGDVADAARVVDAWPLADDLLGCAFACAGPRTLAAREPRDPTRPLAALAHGWMSEATGQATLVLVADRDGAARAATWLPGAPAHAVDDSGLLYLPRLLADAEQSIGLGARCGVTVLSADLRRVALTLAAGALARGESGDEAFTCLAVRDGVLALGGWTEGKRLAATANALQATAQDGLEGMLVVIRLW